MWNPARASRHCITAHAAPSSNLGINLDPLRSQLCLLHARPIHVRVVQWLGRNSCGKLIAGKLNRQSSSRLAVFDWQVTIYNEFADGISIICASYVAYTVAVTKNWFISQGYCARLFQDQAAEFLLR